MKCSEVHSTSVILVSFITFWIQLGCAYKLFSCDSIQVHDTELILYSHDSGSKTNIKEIHNKKHQNRTF